MVNSVWPDVGRKSGLNFETIAQKGAKEALNQTVMFFIIAQKVTKYLDYFCKKICFKELSKNNQSGHSGGHKHCLEEKYLHGLFFFTKYEEKMHSNARYFQAKIYYISTLTSKRFTGLTTGTNTINPIWLQYNYRKKYSFFWSIILGTKWVCICNLHCQDQSVLPNS